MQNPHAQKRRLAFVGAALVLALPGVLVGASSAHAAPPQYEVAAVLTMPNDGADVEVDPVRGVAYVAARVAGQVLVYDIGSLAHLATIAVPDQPYNLAVHPDSGHVYVSQYTENFVAGSVSVIDPDERAVVATLPAGSSPVGVTVTGGGDRLYVSNYFSNFLSVFDTSDPGAPVALPNLPIPSAAETTTESADGSRLFAVRSLSNAVSVIDVATGSVTANWTGFKAPHQLELSTDAATAFVTGQQSPTGSIVDVTTGSTVSAIPLTNSSYTSRDDSLGAIFMTSSTLNGGSVAVIDADDGSITQALPASRAYYSATDPVTHRTFVTSLNAPALTVIDRIIDPPLVTLDPASITAVEGDAVTFSAAASSDEPMTVFWQQSTDNGETWTAVESATSDDLNLPGVSLSQSGTFYQAVYSNSRGTVYTAPAALAVTPATPTPTEPASPTEPPTLTEPANPTEPASPTEPMGVVEQAGADPQRLAATGVDSAVPAIMGALLLVGGAALGFLARRRKRAADEALEPGRPRRS